MRERQVACPACGTQLLLPPDCISRVARCGRCQVRFNLPARISVTDDAVANWLTEGKPDPDVESEGKNGGRPVIEPPHSGTTSVLSAMTENVHVVQVDSDGALLEFPAHRLLELAFRTSIPRRCLQCGSRAHLRVHAIVFGGQLRDSAMVEREHSAGAALLSDDQLRQLSCEDVIKRMPAVTDVQHPADQPMPYWICDMCTGKGVIAGQMNVDPQTLEGLCRLRIRNVHRAAEFLSAAGGYGTSEYHEMMRRVAAMAENAWDTLPEAVQHRLVQWFKPAGDEQFLAYVPDRDRTRTEDGMVGFVATNQRIIYHSQVRHKEAPVAEPVELELSMSSGKGTISVKTSLWELRRVTVDREGVDRLRRALVQARFKAVWR